MFTTPLRLEVIDDTSWMVYEPLVYESPLIGTVIVPKGFVTDLDSTPKWIPLAYAIIKGSGKAAAVQHDWHYQTHEVKKETADKVFLEALTSLKEPVWKCQAMYRAVRDFGQPSYNSGPSRYKLLGNPASVST